MWTWAAQTRRSSHVHTHTRASSIASASRLRARLWASSSPAAVPPLATVSSRSCPVCPSTAVTLTCATAPPAGRSSPCSCCRRSACSSGSCASDEGEGGDNQAEFRTAQLTALNLHFIKTPQKHSFFSALMCSAVPFSPVLHVIL